MDGVGAMDPAFEGALERVSTVGGGSRGRGVLVSLLTLSEVLRARGLDLKDWFVGEGGALPRVFIRNRLEADEPSL